MTPALAFINPFCDLLPLAIIQKKSRFSPDRARAGRPRPNVPRETRYTNPRRECFTHVTHVRETLTGYKLRTRLLCMNRNAIKQSLYRERQRERGLVAVQAWIPADKKELHARYVAALVRQHEKERAGKTGK